MKLRTRIWLWNILLTWALLSTAGCRTTPQATSSVASQPAVPASRAQGTPTDTADISRAYREAMEVIAQNIANAETVGYRRVTPRLPPGLTSGDTQTLTAFASGASPSGPSPTKVTAAIPDATAWADGSAEIRQTGDQLDLAIQGPGFFEVELPDGTRGFTRDGRFRVALNGKVVTLMGYPLRAGFQPISQGSSSIAISPEGAVTSRSEAGTQTFQVQLCIFDQPGKLEPMGGSCYRMTAESGVPSLLTPGAPGAGRLLQGYVEGSTVKIVEEMVALIELQRSYEAFLQTQRPQR